MVRLYTCRLQCTVKMLKKEFEEILTQVPILYKYVSTKTAMLIFENSKLKISNPKKFNDPLDCYPELISFREIPKDYFETRKEKYGDIFPNLFQKPRPTDKEIEYSFKKVAFPQIISRIGTTCFSQTYLEPLMWSHYSNSHSGICIGFNLMKLYLSLKENEKALAKINYVETFEPIEYFSNPFNSIHKWLNTKSKNWEYEREIRLIFTNTDLNNNLENFISFDTNSIDEVIFGLNFSFEDNNASIKKIDKNLPNANKFQMAIKEKSFNLKRFEINP